jgi:hypothetical protein
MNQSPEYQSGIEVERRVIYLLGLTASSQADNIKKDIDAHNNGRTFSIKCQHTALKTGNLAFELETVDAQGKRTPSWFQTGRADDYIIVVGDNLYWIDRRQLSQYVTDNGWDKVVGLTLKTQKSQTDIGHPHVNAKVGLISLKKLMREYLIHSVQTLLF